MSKTNGRWRWLIALALLQISWAACAAVGRLEGVAEVSGNGAATYTIPIFTPPGTAGLTPQLAFTYSSNSGSSPLGIGWGLAGLSRIERCPTIWASDGVSRNILGAPADRFCLDGVQLKYVSGPAYGGAGTRYATEIESFARITSQGAAGFGPVSFVVERRDGLIYEYGNTADSRIEILGVATVRTWALNKIRDRSGNSILFNYIEDAVNGSYRINTIQYTANPSQGVGAPYQIAFLYESLPPNEVDTQFLAGGPIRRVVRVDRVDVTHEGSLVRRYEFNFEPALSSTNRSRLQSIQECAGTTVDCKAATTFTYQDGTAGLFAPNSTGINTVVPPLPMDVNGDGRIDVAFPSSATPGAGAWLVSFANADGSYAGAVNTGIANNNFGQAIPIDYNADGRDDMLVPFSGGTWWALLGTDSGLAGPFDTGIPASGAVTGRATTMDVNGDGLDDLVWYDTATIFQRIRNLAGTFSAPIAIPLEPGSQISSGFGSASMQFRARNRQPTFNGDARKGFIVKVMLTQGGDPEIGGPTRTTFLWQIVQSGNQEGDVVAVQQQNFNAPIKYLDINGDGQTDIVYPSTTAGTYRYRISSGLGLGPELIGPAVQSVNFAEAAVLDWEGDGDQDLLARSNTTGELLLMRATGETLQPFVGTGQVVSGGIFFVGDANGDGQDDLLFVDGSSNLTRMLHAGVLPDVLDRATDGFGNYTDFNYATLSSSDACYSRDAPAPVYPQSDYREPVSVVCSTTANNGIGGTYTVSHQYYNTSVNLQGRGFEGFGAKGSRDSRNGLYAYQYFNLGFPYTGTTRQAEQRQSNNAALISRVQSNWTAYSYGSGTESRFFPYVSSGSTQQYEVGGTFNGVLIRSSSTINQVDMGTGTRADSITTVTEANNANGLSAGASYTLRTYSSALFNDFTNWCFGRPTTTQQINSHSLYGGSQQTRTLNTAWDGVYCRPTQTVIEPGNPTRQVTSDLTYDGFGNLSTQTVTPVGETARITELNWGADGRFPRSVKNPLLQVTALDWWSDLGQLRSATDPNGLVTSNSYDPFGRLINEVAPDSTSTLVEYLACDADCTGFSNSKYKVRTTLRDTGNATIAQGFRLIDGFDRVRRTSSYALEGGLINQLTEYDAFGRVSRTSVPYFNLSGSPVWTTVTYDTLGRQLQAVRDRASDADASQSINTIQYDGLTVTTTDPLGKVRTDTFDPLGQVKRALQASSTAEQSTTGYDYDAFGNLVRTTDTAGNQILVGYDIRGFKINSTDPDLGAWTYDYYASGELKTQTDAKSQTTSFTYDKLSRPLTRIEPADSGSGTQTTTWTWGSSAANFNIGQLQSVAVGGFSESYSYDNRSRLVSTTVIADGGTYVVGQSYNATTGLQETITYPSSTGATPLTVKYEYETANASGLLQRVKDFNTGTVFWQAVSSNALGQYQDVTLGNGLKTLTAFDSITGVTNRIETGPAGGNVRQNLQYAWDKVGNVTSRQDLNISKTENFTYDNLHRLTQAQVIGNTALTLAYDVIGNITNKSDLGAYSYHPTKKHAVTTAGAITLTYDANGNVETQTRGTDTATVSWTAYNLPKLISTTSNRSSQFLYGADRQRYKQVALISGVTETTIYVKGIFERVTRPFGTEYRHFIQGPDGVIAILNRKSSGTTETRYLLKDHLGSTDVITDEAGASRVKLSFNAFGARRNGNTWAGSPTSADQIALAGTSRLGFTGHEELDHLDLIHMNGRVYQPTIGRFISADPFVQSPFNSQSLNRYSYVFNNPLSFTDPSGFTPICLRIGGSQFSGDVNSSGNAGVTLTNCGGLSELGGGGGGFFFPSPGICSDCGGRRPAPSPTTPIPIPRPTEVPGVVVLGGEGWMSASTVGGGDFQDFALGFASGLDFDFPVSDGDASTAGFYAGLIANALTVNIQDLKNGRAGLGSGRGGGSRRAAASGVNLSKSASSTSIGRPPSGKPPGDGGPSRQPGRPTDTVDLFRAVGVRELASINKNGAFLAGGNSLEARQFALSFADALSYANADPSKVAIIRATIRRDALSSFDFSRNIDPFIFRNGVVTVQPGTQTDIFNRALLSIDQAL